MPLSGAFIAVFVLLVVCLGISCSALGLAVTNKSTSNKKSAANKPNFVVQRDNVGNFATASITLEGPVANPTNVATKQYSDIQFKQQYDPHTVINNSAAENNHLAAFQGTTGTLIANTSLNVNDVVTTLGPSDSNAIAIFVGNSGKLIEAATTTIDQLVPLTGATQDVDLGLFTMNCKTQQVPTLGKLSTTTSSGFALKSYLQSIVDVYDGNLVFAPNSITNATSLQIRIVMAARGDGDRVMIIRLVNTSNSATLAISAIPTHNILTLNILTTTINISFRNSNDVNTTCVSYSNKNVPIVTYNEYPDAWDKTVENTIDVQASAVDDLDLQVIQLTIETIYSE